MGKAGTGLKRGLLAGVAVAATGYGVALAQTNEAGEVIGNTFTLDYTVGGQQTTIDNTANPTTFTVDRKVDLEVTGTGGVSNAAPGSTGQLLTYTVTNEGNDNFRYILSVTDASSGDDFDTTNPTGAYVSFSAPVAAGGSCPAAAGDYTDGTTTTTDVAPGEFVCVRVLRDVPGTATDAQEADVFLTAQAAFPGSWNGAANAGTPGTAGQAVTEETGNNAIDGTAQNVFLDGQGGGAAGDGEDDGRDSAQETVIVSSQPLTASKYVYSIASDGTTCAVPAANAVVAEGDVLTSATSQGNFFVPGACVVYVIEADNANGSNATGINITDVLPGTVDYVGSAAYAFGSASVATTGDCSAGTATNCQVAMTGGTLASGGTGRLVIAARVD